MAASGGFGVSFKIGATAVAAVDSINGFEVEALLDEITTHGSAGGFREMLPTGKFQASDVELVLVFDIAQATHANSAGGLTHALLNKTKMTNSIVFPGAVTWSFSAYCKKIKWQSPQDQAVRANVTLAVTGACTLT